MIELIREYLVSNGFSLEEAKIFPESQVPFWHTVVLDAQRNAVSAGFGANVSYSRKVAIAEFLERKTYLEIKKADSTTQNKWGLHLMPTACGCAVGFVSHNAVMRSLTEATERWVISKWIDDGCHIEEQALDSVEGELDEVSKFLATQFERVSFYRKKVDVVFAGVPVQIEVAQTMGFLDGGIYPGSSAQKTGGSLWQHAMIESFRHLLFVKNNPKREHRFPDNKIHFFSRNASIALEQIRLAKNQEWPKPEVIFHRMEPFMNSQFFLARTILGGWRPWNEGPIERFLF